MAQKNFIGTTSIVSNKPFRYYEYKNFHTPNGLQWGLFLHSSKTYPSGTNLMGSKVDATWIQVGSNLYVQAKYFQEKAKPTGANFSGVDGDKFNLISNQFAHGGYGSRVRQSTSVDPDKGKKDFSGEEFFSAVGKKVLCKAQGLSGADKRLCNKQILASCGRKPVCLNLLSLRKCRRKQADWLKCAQAQAVTSGAAITAASTPADTGLDTGTDTDTTGAGSETDTTKGAGINWIPYAIGGAVLLIAGIGAAVLISKSSKAKLQAIK